MGELIKYNNNNNNNNNNINNKDFGGIHFRYQQERISKYLAKSTTCTSHNENMFPCISLGVWTGVGGLITFNDFVICKYRP